MSTNYCPYCQRHGDFLPHGVASPIFATTRVVGGGRRERVKCPACGSTDRERLLFVYMTTAIGFRLTGFCVLHIAPERRLFWLIRNLKPDAHVTADLKKDATIRLDISRMPMRGASFDLIVCNHVLEHVADDRRAMAELLRVLKPDGRAILQVPVALARDRTDEDPDVTTPDARLERFGQNDHVRLYGRDYQERLAAAGFDVECVSCTSLVDEPLIAQYGLLRDETIFVARHPLHEAART